MKRLVVTAVTVSLLCIAQLSYASDDVASQGQNADPCKLNGNKLPDNLKFWSGVTEWECRARDNRILVLDRNTGLYGYVDYNGKLVIKPQYDVANGFYEGYAVVERSIGNHRTAEGKIDPNGKLIIPMEYESLPPGLSEGYISALKSSTQKYGVLTEHGQVVINFDYDWIGSMSEGVIWAKKGDKFGYLDLTGKVVIPFTDKYIDVGDFADGLAEVTVKKNGEVYNGKIDHDGKEVIAPLYYAISDFEEGLASVQQNGKYGFVNRSGNVVIPIIYEDSDSFREGLATAKLHGKWGAIDRKNQGIIPFEYDSLYSLPEKNSFRYLASKIINGKETLFRINKRNERKPE